MIGTMIFKDSQVTIGNKVETLVCHGVPIFVVGFVHLHCSIKLLLFEVKDKDEAKQEELMHCSGFLRKIFDIFVHLSSNCIGHVSPWIVDHPRNLRENVSGCIQDWEHTRCPGTCRALTYLQGVTQGEQVPAECLSRSVIIMYKSKYIHRGLYLSRSEKKAAFSSYSSLTLYNRWVTRRMELNKKAVTHY